MASFNWLVSGSALVFGLGLIFAFSNGFRNSSLIVSTVVSTRALSPSAAFRLCAVFEFLGALVLGSAVVKTIGTKMFGQAFVVHPHDVKVTLAAALLGVIIWGAIGWWRAWPISNSQALFGSLTGASWAAWGFEHLHNNSLLWVYLFLILTPILGVVLAVLLSIFVRWIGGWFTTRINPFVEKLHILSCMLVSSADGSNDGQMVMGVAMLAWGLIQTTAVQNPEAAFSVPFVIRLIVAAAIGLGVLMGGKRILKKVGMEFYRIQMAQGFVAQVASAGLILTSIGSGFPASATQVITGSIVGAGVAKNPRSVNWTIAKDIAMSWLITIPGAAILSAGLYEVLFKWGGWF